MQGQLYAVIKGRPIVWAVVAFTEGYPQMVPVGRWDPERGGEYEAVPVAAGQVWVPTRDDEVAYAPDHMTLVTMILTRAGEPA